MVVTQPPQEMLRQLISFNTISALSNKDMIQFIADYLAGHGISSSVGGNEDGTKAIYSPNLFENDKRVNSIIYAGYGGQSAGQAIADVLYKYRNVYW